MPFDSGFIFVIFGCVIFGFVGGAAITYWWSQREKRHQPDNLPLAAPAPGPEVTPAPIPQPTHAAPLAQLWQDKENGDLNVEMDSRSYEKAAQLSPEERARMVEILRDWVTWLGFNLPAQPTPPAPAAAPAPEPTLAPVPAAAPVISRPVPVSAATPVASAPIAESEKKTPQRPKSMVEQVDDILQEMQTDLPINTARIKLMENTQHGIVAWIGLEHYNGIENIPNEEARQLVKRAVAEWERRAG